jgi:cysteine desulfurase family protein (TIGR01976 family)
LLECDDVGMPAVDLDAIRARFPALQRTGPDGRPYVHADAPGGTQVPADVITAITAYLRRSNANQHGPFVTSEETDALCAQVREQAARFTGGEAEGVVFGPNMTTLTWHFARALARGLRRGDEIVCTRLDHDANVAPWLAAAGRTGAVIRWVELASENGGLDLDSLDRAVTDRTRLVAFPAASNALGTLVDPGPFVAAAQSVGALSFMDAVHAAPHVPLDRRHARVDVLACSPYKFFGPHAGLLSARPAILADLQPEKVRPAPDAGPERWQTGTTSFEAIAGIGAAIAYLDEVGLDAVGAHEQVLTRRFIDALDGLPHVRLHGTTDAGRRTPTFAVTVAGHSPGAVASALAAQGIFTSAGHHYAVEPMRALGLLNGGGAVRVGFVHYHGTEDVDRVTNALDQLG